MLQEEQVTYEALNIPECWAILRDLVKCLAQQIPPPCLYMIVSYHLC